MTEIKEMLYVVIPVHNYITFTRQCLRSLIGLQIHRQFSVIVVDDGSSDGTAELIKTEFPDVTLLKGDGNLWWSGATNLGIRHALSQSTPGDFILTLNNDTLFDEDYLSNLVRSAHEHPHCLIGSLTVNADNPRQVVDAGVQVNWLTAKLTPLVFESGKCVPTSHEVDFLPGRGTLIPVEVFDRIGLYAEQHLPHYGADYEFSWRAKKHGYPLIIDYECVIKSLVSITGLNNRVNSLTWSEFWISFVTTKSPLQIKTRWNFAKLCLPFPKSIFFFFLDIARVGVGSLRSQLYSRRGRSG